MIASPWIAAAATLFVWWFATGAILLAAKRLERASLRRRALAVVLSAPAAAYGAALIWTTRADGGVEGAYLAAAGAILIWGWLEFGFLTGVIAGPNVHPLPPGRPPWERFVRAWGAIAYHEILLLAALLAVFWAVWDQENIFAFWTFAVLFFARVSAQLNLFLGVIQINVDFLPRPLSHVPSHFRIAPWNPLFPVSITALTFAGACFVERAAASDTSGRIAGFTILAALTALALIEHWMMMSRLPDDRLWRWMLPTAKPETAARREGD